MSGDSCEFSRAGLVLYDNDKNQITASTSPFSFDGTKLVFSSTSPEDQGIITLEQIGITFYVNDDPDNINFVPEEKDEKDKTEEEKEAEKKEAELEKGLSRQE